MIWLSVTLVICRCHLGVPGLQLNPHSRKAEGQTGCTSGTLLSTSSKAMVISLRPQITTRETPVHVSQLLARGNVQLAQVYSI